MNNCKVKFISNIDGVSNNIVTLGVLKKQNKNFSVAFFYDTEKSVEYVFSVINNKVTMSSKGLVSYRFVLEKGKQSCFSMNLLGGEILCTVTCYNVEILTNQNKTLVKGSYDINVNGNNQKCLFSLEVEEDLWL